MEGGREDLDGEIIRGWRSVTDITLSNICHMYIIRIKSYIYTNTIGRQILYIK